MTNSGNKNGLLLQALLRADLALSLAAVVWAAGQVRRVRERGDTVQRSGLVSLV